MSQLALAGAAGSNSVQLRPPYSSTPTPCPHGTSVASRKPFTTVTWLFLPTGTARTGSGRTGRASWRMRFPVGDAGAVIMFHDGGGDCSQTVKPSLRHRHP